MTAQSVNKWLAPNLGQKQAPKVNEQQIEEQRQQGFEKGYQEGLAKAQTESKVAIQALKDLTSQIKGINELIEVQTLSLIQTYCQQVVQAVMMRAIESDFNVIKNLIEAGVQQLASQQQVVLELNPQIFETYAEDLTTSFQSKGIHIFSNPNIKPQQVIIKDCQQTLKSDLFEVIEKMMTQSGTSDDS